MKKIILASIIMLTSAISANAQTTIFSDNFESYTNNQLLNTVSVPTYGGAYVSGASTEIKAITGMVGRIAGAASAGITVSLRKTIAVIAGHNYTFSAKTFSGQVNSRSIGYLFTTSGVTGSSTTLSNNIMTPQSVTFTAATSENVVIFVSNVGTAHLQTDDWLVADNTPTVTVTPIGTYTYTGSPQGPSAATNTGTGSSYTFSYVGTGTTSYAASATAPTNAGTYTVTATVAANGNYTQASSSATAFSILSTGEVAAINTNISSLTLSANSNIAVGTSGSLIVNQNTTVNSVTVAAGGKLTISGGALTVTNGITLQSNSTGTATFVDTNNNSPQAMTGIVQQYLTDQRNWYTTSPITAGAASGLNLGTSVQTYSESAKGWTILTGSDALVAGKGYVSVATTGTGTTGTVSFNGTLNTGTITVPVTRTESGTSRGFNLVANPYPSYLDWSLVTADPLNANIGSTMWFRTKNTLGAYTFATHNGTSGETVTGTSNTTITKFIPPLQAFWIRVNANVGQTTYSTNISFKNGMRAHADDNGNKLKAPKMDERKRLRLQVSNGAMVDETLLYFDTNAQDSFDNYDSPKMFNNTASMPEIYTQVGSEKLVINGMSELKSEVEIPIGFVTNKADNFSISVSELKNIDSLTGLILKDKFTNSQIKLDATTVYEFSSEITPASISRFSLLLRAPSTATSIENGKQNNISVYINAANEIVINSQEGNSYSIHNSLGQKITGGKVSGSKTILKGLDSHGIFIVKVGDTSKKIVI